MSPSPPFAQLKNSTVTKMLQQIYEQEQRQFSYTKNAHHISNLFFFNLIFLQLIPNITILRTNRLGNLTSVYLNDSQRDH